MEIIDALQQLIANYGFPVVACIAMFKQMNKQTEIHKQELDVLRGSIDRNTEIITRLYERWDTENES